MRHWLYDYLGNAWEGGATGPESWDCWTLFREVQATHYGNMVPLLGDIAHRPIELRHTIMNQKQGSNWDHVDDPRDGDAVLMYKGRYADHVGVFIEPEDCPGRVLHCVQGSGVICTPVATLGDMGWSKLDYYRYIG